MNRAPTAFLQPPATALHDTGRGHPEHAGRLRELAAAVEGARAASGGRIEELSGTDPATGEALGRAHDPAHVAAVRDACSRAEEVGGIVGFDAETVVSPGSWAAITAGVGAALTAVRSVVAGRHRNAFVATRPPGHHATPDRAMGFCLINSVAVAARAAQAEGLAERVLILDWDVHHGNGTQEIFLEDPSVYYLSLHESPAYPGTGSAAERGAGPGEGATLNLPLPAGTGRELYLAALDEGLERATAVFRPELILVSAGYDALAGDPLGRLRLEPSDFHEITRRVTAVADSLCQGRLVALLEGGYDPVRTGRAAAATVRALAGMESSEPAAPHRGAGG